MTTASRRAADELAARSAAGQLFVIDLWDGTVRGAAHIFACDQGVAFADLGWDDPGTIGQHTMHVLEGRVRFNARFLLDHPQGPVEFLTLDDNRRRLAGLPPGPLDPGPRELARHHCGNLCTGIGP